jgi:6-phosphogluconate dehydrogenase
VAPVVQDSGEGRWTVLEAVEQGVPAPVIAAALNARFSSRDETGYAARILSVLRGQFGGHAVAAMETDGGAADLLAAGPSAGAAGADQAPPS